jgi:hypothetical protein
MTIWGLSLTFSLESNESTSTCKYVVVCTYVYVLTILVHAHLHALLEPACLALVPVGLVNDAGSVSSLTPTDMFSRVQQF